MKTPNQDILNADDMHSAFIVDEQGNEIPITREMIDSSCEQLIASDHYLDIPNDKEKDNG